MIQIRRATIGALAVALAFTSACNKEKTPAAQNGASAPSASGAAPTPTMDPNTPVAEIAGQKITAGELEKELGPQMEAMAAEYEKQVFEARKARLENLVIERLVKAEAQKKGMSEEEFVAAEIDSSITPPDEAQMKKMYEEAKSRLPPGTTYDQVKGQISQFLTQNQRSEKLTALIDRLKKENNVKILLQQPRKQVAATGPSKGPNDAPITIVEFSDFECPYCSRAESTVKQVMDTYAGKVKLVFRHYPLNFHPNAQKAAEASACADDQGKFWELHGVLFENARALQVDSLKKYAQQVGLDMAKFNECLDSGAKADLVKQDMEAGSKVGVNGTPAFFINGIPLSGAVPFEQFKAIIDQELASKS